MAPKFEYINPKDMPKQFDKGTYYVMGGRGNGKSWMQYQYMRAIIKLYNDIEACNIELAKIERRNNDRTD